MKQNRNTELKHPRWLFCVLCNINISSVCFVYRLNIFFVICKEYYRGVFVSVNFGFFVTSRCESFHCNTVNVANTAPSLFIAHPLFLAQLRNFSTADLQNSALCYLQKVLLTSSSMFLSAHFSWTNLLISLYQRICTVLLIKSITYFLIHVLLCLLPLLWKRFCDVLK